MESKLENQEEGKKPVVKKVKKEDIIKRNFTGSDEINSDLFKLVLGYFTKDISVIKKKVPDPQDLQKVPHAHFYHSVDSNGREMDSCNAVGGHKHTVTVKYDKDGEIVSAVCGKSTGPIDDHIHEIEYIKTDKVERRIRNKNTALLVSSAERYN